MPKIKILIASTDLEKCSADHDPQADTP